MYSDYECNGPKTTVLAVPFRTASFVESRALYPAPPTPFPLSSPSLLASIYRRTHALGFRQ